jgi:hypothetical protein
VADGLQKDQTDIAVHRYLGDINFRVNNQNMFCRHEINFGVESSNLSLFLIGYHEKKQVFMT